MPVRRDRVSVLVLSVWVEEGWPDEGSDGGFRARITATDSRTPGEDLSTVVATPEQVLGAVGDWLEAQRGGLDDPRS